MSIIKIYKERKSKAKTSKKYHKLLFREIPENGISNGFVKMPGFRSVLVYNTSLIKTEVKGKGYNCFDFYCFLLKH